MDSDIVKLEAQISRQGEIIDKLIKANIEYDLHVDELKDQVKRLRTISED